MKLTSQESDLTGMWQLRLGTAVADATCKRIEWLIANHLVQLGADASGWSELYRDPEDGRLWELTWPQAEIHGGGPPRLTFITADVARSRYGAVVDG